MKSILSFFKHLKRWREFYLVPLLLVVLCVGALHLVRYLTGRPSVDDPGVIVSYCYNGIGGALVMLLTGLTQEIFFGFRSERPPQEAEPHVDSQVPFRDDVFDAAVTAFLLILWSVIIFSLKVSALLFSVSH